MVDSLVTHTCSMFWFQLPLVMQLGVWGLISTWQREVDSHWYVQGLTVPRSGKESVFVTILETSVQTYSVHAFNLSASLVFQMNYSSSEFIQSRQHLGSVSTILCFFATIFFHMNNFVFLNKSSHLALSELLSSHMTTLMSLLEIIVSSHFVWLSLHTVFHFVYICLT